MIDKLNSIYVNVCFLILELRHSFTKMFFLSEMLSFHQINDFRFLFWDISCIKNTLENVCIAVLYNMIFFCRKAKNIVIYSQGWSLYFIISIVNTSLWQRQFTYNSFKFISYHINIIYVVLTTTIIIYNQTWLRSPKGSRYYIWVSR